MSRESPTVVIAPTAFKGTLTPSRAAAAIARGVRRVWPRADIRIRPLSDGGTGTLDALAALEKVVTRSIQVTGPLGARVRAAYLRSGRSAVIESAEACGLHRVPRGREDPLSATTRGVGELLMAAAEDGAERIILGLGGSATVDGGTGMARALGWRFLDASGRSLPEGGGALIELERIERPPPAVPSIPVTALCDVGAPLVGPAGAARVFSPQKGAGPQEIERLAAGLERLAAVIEHDVGIEAGRVAGGGAAGGLGAGALAFLGAQLTSGADWMIGRARLKEALRGANLVITGEGRYDEQSSMGKITGRLLALTSVPPIPTLVVAGRVEGRLPAHARGLEGRYPDRTLTAAGIAGLVESGCRALIAQHRL